MQEFGDKAGWQEGHVLVQESIGGMLCLTRPMPCPSLPSLHGERFLWMPNEVQCNCLDFILQAELYFLKEI